jgi:broad specificity phosphatase PhoE
VASSTGNTVMRIYLVRHGHSTWQRSPSDDLDTGLSDVGHEQARRLACWLARHERVDETLRVEVASVVTSPLRRARDTAAYAEWALELDVGTLPSLSEASFHVADHLPRADGPLLVAAPFTPSLSYRAFRAQARTALAELAAAADASGGPVLAVAHGGLVKTLLRVVTGTDHVCFRLYNTGLTLLEWRCGRWHLAFLNLLDHVPPDLRTS